MKTMVVLTMKSVLEISVSLSIVEQKLINYYDSVPANRSANSGLFLAFPYCVEATSGCKRIVLSK